MVCLFFYRLQKLEAYWLEEMKSTEELCFCGLFPCRAGHTDTRYNGHYGIVTNDKEGFLGRLFEGTLHLGNGDGKYILILFWAMGSTFSITS